MEKTDSNPENIMVEGLIVPDAADSSLEQINNPRRVYFTIKEAEYIDKPSGLIPAVANTDRENGNEATDNTGIVKQSWYFTLEEAMKAEELKETLREQ